MKSKSLILKLNVFLKDEIEQWCSKSVADIPYFKKIPTSNSRQQRVQMNKPGMHKIDFPSTNYEIWLINGMKKP